MGRIDVGMRAILCSPAVVLLASGDTTRVAFGGRAGISQMA